MEKLFIPESCVMESQSMVIRNEGDVEIINKLIPAAIYSTKGSILYRNSSSSVMFRDICAERGHVELETGSLVSESVTGASARILCGDLTVRESLTVAGELEIEADAVDIGFCRAGKLNLRGGHIRIDTIEASGDIVLSGDSIKANLIRGGNITLSGTIECKEMVASGAVIVQKGKVSIKSLDAPRFQATPDVTGIVVMATCDIVRAEGVRGFLQPNELETMGLDATKGHAPAMAPKISGDGSTAARPVPVTTPEPASSAGTEWAFAAPGEDDTDSGELTALDDDDMEESYAGERTEGDHEVSAWSTRRVEMSDEFSSDDEDTGLDDTNPAGEPVIVIEPAAGSAGLGDSGEDDDRFDSGRYDLEPDEDDGLEMAQANDSGSDILDSTGSDLESGAVSDMLDSTGIDTEFNGSSDILNPSGAYAIVDSGSDVLDHPGVLQEEDLEEAYVLDGMEAPEFVVDSVEAEAPVVGGGFSSSRTDEVIAISTEDFSDVEELEEIESLEPLDPVDESLDEGLHVGGEPYSEDDTDLLVDDEDPLEDADQPILGDDLDEARDALEDSMDDSSEDSFEESEEEVLEDGEEDVLEIEARSTDTPTEEVHEQPEE